MSKANQEQVEYWNGRAGTTWVNYQERMDAMLEPLSAATLASAAVQAGERVIDVGCGCGATSLALAREGASVWGLDISAMMLERAVARGREAGLEQATFSETDAATQAFAPEHDLIFSRFGVMFFSDPSAAFANLRTALKPGGRLCFLCWRKPRENPWMSVAGAAIQPLLPEPASPPDPRAPGPFAFADPDYITAILEGAGYRDVTVTAVDRTVHLADSLDDALDFQAQIGPLARALAELDEDALEQARALARAALAEHVSGDGLNLGAACWLVQARNG